MENLEGLLSADIRNVVIQCHDNPDADAIASGFALYEFFKEKGKETDLIYSGSEKISKPNLVEMVDYLDIPIKYVKKLETPPDLLIMVDCQYGAKNVMKIQAPHIAVIDHHQKGKLPESANMMLEIIEPAYNSCSTLVWQILWEGHGIEAKDKNVATALYYGLYMDTFEFSGLSYAMDKEMADVLEKYYDAEFIKALKFKNLTLQDLITAGVSLIRHSHNPFNRFAVFRADTLDQNLLGVISDTVITVDTVDVSIVYTQSDDTVRFSLRSCTKDVGADDLAVFLSKGIGGGGGHLDKAGGRIVMREFNETYPGFNIDAHFLNKTSHYLGGLFDKYYCEKQNLEPTEMNMKKYIKKEYTVGVVPTLDCFPKGTPIRVRCLEGDTFEDASKDTYIIIGVVGELYFVKRKKIEESYVASPRSVMPKSEYPKVKNLDTGEFIDVTEWAKPYKSNDRSYSYAVELKRPTKVFTKCNKGGYMLGNPEDFLVVTENDYSDYYIVQRDIFLRIYESC